METRRPAYAARGSEPVNGSETLPTVPCSVVWSRGHAYVLELVLNRSRWVGVDDRGRPVEYSCTELQRRGWSRTAH